MTKKLLKDIARKKKEKKIVPIAMTEEERNKIQKKADEYADGNISAWMRISAMRFKPSIRDLVDF